MHVTTGDGRRLRIGRRWLPWRPRPREFDGPVDSFDLIGGDDPVSFALSIVLALALTLLAPLIAVVVLLTGELLLALLLVPLVAAVRVLLRRPWLVEVRDGRTLLSAEPVVGWRASGERIRELSVDPSLLLRHTAETAEDVTGRRD
ncbi:MAG: hypothetical protein ACXVW6_03790 [Nocardioidaceae bacterium]